MYGSLYIKIEYIIPQCQRIVIKSDAVFHTRIIWADLILPNYRIRRLLQSVGSLVYSLSIQTCFLRLIWCLFISIISSKATYTHYIPSNGVRTVSNTLQQISNFMSNPGQK